jgi:hypothetical protein
MYGANRGLAGVGGWFRTTDCERGPASIVPNRGEVARMGMWFMFVLSVYGVPLLFYLAFTLPALYYLRRRDLDETSRAVWSLAIVAVPVMGAVAFVVMQPGGHPR